MLDNLSCLVNGLVVGWVAVKKLVCYDENIYCIVANSLPIIHRA